VLDQVDRLLRAVLRRDVAGLTSDQHIGFQPPDDDWRKAVVNLNDLAVNVYLVDLRENRALRTHDWQVVVDGGQPRREPGPMRVDCHYLISAWSPAAAAAPMEPTLDEHGLLYRVMAALANADPLNPTHVYPPGSAVLAGVDPLIRDADLPVQIVPSEGWPKLTEFWSAMGANFRARPAIWYVVTVPVAMTAQLAGPLVTTRIIEFRQDGDPSSAEQWLQIGGTVTDTVGAAVDGAVVTITGTGGRVIDAVTTGADGCFSIGALQATGYAIHAAKPGIGTADRTASPPGNTGDYDLTLT
jgi:hypothetical protein